MDDYREAVCVHLHDQRVMITDDPISYGTDSQCTEDVAEYALSTNLTKALGLLLGLDPNDLIFSGISRGYAEFPSRGATMQRIEVRIVSDRIIDLRLKLKVKDGEWIEEWTYAGSFTIKWAETT